MDFVGTLKLAAQEVQFIWNECQMPARVKSKQHTQIHLNGLDPQLIEDSFVALSTYNDIHSTKKCNAEICMNHTTEVATFAATLKPRHWCYFGVASEKTFWNGHSNNLKGRWDFGASQMVDIFKCHTLLPTCSATALSFGQLKKGKNDHFHNTDGKYSHRYHIGRQLVAYLHLHLPVVRYRKFGTEKYSNLHEFWS